MPKATWGDFSSDDIDSAETREGFAPYAGAYPRSGLFRFTIKAMKQGESQKGNPKMLIVAEIDGSWKPEHKKYDGCPLFDHMPVTKQTAFRVKAFCEAVGLPSKEFQNKIITDDDGKVTKLGSLGDPAGLQVYVNITQRPKTEEYPDPQLSLVGTGYLPIDDEDEDEDDEDEVLEDPDDDDDEPPF